MDGFRSVVGWSGAVLLSLISVAAVAQPAVRFIENKNQWRRPVLYGASVPRADVFLLENKIQYLVRESVASDGKNRKKKVSMVAEGGPHLHRSYIRSQLYEVDFVNSNEHPFIETEDPSITTYNYFLGNDRSKWAQKAHGFSAVKYSQVYCDIDLRVYSENQQLKQDWIVHPHANSSQIQLKYIGCESIHLVEGSLVVETEAGTVTELKPFAFQLDGAKKIPIACSYRLKGSVLTYEFPNDYDHDQDLVIDPILIFSGYSGSTYDNWGNSATNDVHGNLYSGGAVTTNFGGVGFPTTPGAYGTVFAGGDWDIGILKYDSSGANLLYVTYLGGNGTEAPQSMVVDKDGALLIIGATSSTNFPVTNGSTFKGGETVDPLWGTTYYNGSDLYVAKLSEDGSSLIAATYLGGTSNDGLNFVSGFLSGNNNTQSVLARNYGDQMRADIISDEDNFVYLASNTLSSDFPVVNPDPLAAFGGGTHDAVLVKLTPDLSSIVWSRLMGGSGTDAAYSLKLDSAGGVYIAGGTNSADFEGMNGLHNTLQGNIDGWIAHVSATGDQVINATYLGTSAYDQTYFIDLNASQEVYAFGQTKGPYPVQGTVYSNPHSGQFLHKLSPDLTTSVFSTVVGSGTQSPNISPTAFLVSECGTIYLSGWGGELNAPDEVLGPGFVIHRNYVGGSTLNLPVTSNAYQPGTSGNDFYFMVLSSDGAHFLYGTFLGGSESLTHVDGGTSRFDKRGVVYHSVCAGCGGVSDFPAINVPPARQFNNSFNCNNAAFKFDLSLLKARIQTNNLHLNAPGFNTLCFPDSLVFQNLSIGGKVFEWDFGDGKTLSKQDSSLIIHSYAHPGDYTIKLKAIDVGTCIGKDSTYAQIHVIAPKGVAGPDQTICSGSSTSLSASGGVAYVWSTEKKDFTSYIADPTISPKDTTNYFVTVTDNAGCLKNDTVKVSVVPAIDLKFTASKEYDCFSRPTVHVQNLTSRDETVFVDFGDGGVSDQDDVTHAYDHDGTYHVKIVGNREFCVYEQAVDIPVVELKVPNVITPGNSPDFNDNFVIEYGGRPISQSAVHASLEVLNRWGGRVYQAKDYQDNWSADNLPSGVYYYEAVIEGVTTCKGWVHVVK